MSDILSTGISTIVATVLATLFSALLVRWFNRRGEKVPQPQLQILGVAWEREEKNGSYISDTQARGKTGLAPDEFEVAMRELEQFGEVRIDHTWSGNWIIVTGKGQLSLLKRRRHP